MPAEKWNIDISEIVEWMINGEQEFNEMLMNFDLEDNPDGASDNQFENKNGEQSGDADFPSQLPILPLRGLVVYPQTAVPLTIGQSRSIKLVDDALSGNRWVGLITSRDAEKENPDPEDLYEYGTAAIIHRLFRAPDGTIRLLVQGTGRFKVKKFIEGKPYIQAEVEAAPEKIEKGLKIEALSRNVRDQFVAIAEMIPSIPRELVATINSLQDPLQTAYNIANLQRMDLSQAQLILEMDSTADKLRFLVGILTKEGEVLDLGQKIQNEAREEIDKVQREYFLREQLKAIRKELGDEDAQSAEVEEFRQKIKEAKMPPEADKQAQLELERLERLPAAAAEYGVIRTYLDWLVSLPWSTATEEMLDIANARKILDHDHYGLDDVKSRIVEYLAVRKLKSERKDLFEKNQSKDDIRKEREGVILCFVGPPGVGKTSLGQSIAKALNRKFVRTSLGGIRDEAEIRGHRRTYIGAMPGRIIQSLRRVESRNPVFMLDEIDKLTFDYHGDPASALLEVLDPEQNSEFRDNYLEVAFDLSQVMFITTANQLDTIPAPLLDRMEVIEISGYTEREKVEIAKGYLIPRQLRENGLMEKELKFKDDAILEIIRSFTRESGVRNLEREIGSVCRKVVTIREKDHKRIRSISKSYVNEMLGKPRFKPSEEVLKRTSVPGVATGLAWTPVGGEILFIEATSMPGSDKFIITGSLGDVMKESATAAFSFLRSHLSEFGIDPKVVEHRDIHIHVPAGAQPKDGPSAGITITVALASLFLGKALDAKIGMTGEITLRGQVLPVGGIKEKMLAAHRAGLKKIFLPKDNEIDLDELPEEVKKDVEFIPVDTAEEVINQTLLSKK
ncbi:ATP-dependent Lon protease [Pelolinea submarina]|uniref:Lon protease n=2 Tax=Pelolinea submarina TaxID=913107 RepID=A0A347ZTC7_9CHLR|nr:endopeptidase La [Pelolinea submarina]REG10867.1 ATP-dependent Lon protease [Pelolinea submarina]BBB48558.1 ATP-dependent Lon protease [Pelolinea submarina]